MQCVQHDGPQWRNVHGQFMQLQNHLQKFIVLLQERHFQIQYENMKYTVHAVTLKSMLTALLLVVTRILPFN